MYGENIGKEALNYWTEVCLWSLSLPTVLAIC
jgi:hypothetical protein